MTEPNGEHVLGSLVLDTGSHDDPNKGVCVMEVAHLAMAATRVNGRWVMRDGADLTDLPACTHRGIARVAQRLWDSSGTRKHHLRVLSRFLPRLMRAKRTTNLRVNVRVALAAARFVEHLAPPEVRACNDTVQRWLDGEASIEEVQTARDAAAYAAADAAYAAYAAAIDAAAAYAAYDAIDAAYAAAIDAAAAYAAYDAAALTDLLDTLLDAHAKALTEEGEAVWDPEPWERDAIDFVDALMAEIEAEQSGSTQGGSDD